MPGLVKLCGMRTPEDARAAAAAGADLVGLVFAPSPRRVSLEEASEIVEALRASPEPPRVVGLFVDAPVETIVLTATALSLDLVQLHGHESPEMVAELPWPVIKAVRVRPGETIEEVERRVAPFFAQARSPFALLVDAYHPRVLGGTGQAVDWAVARALAERYPVILAGGLRPETVAAAIETVRPLGVDVSSGIEVNGRKDPALMEAFVRAARQAFGRMSVTAPVVQKGERP